MRNSQTGSLVLKVVKENLERGAHPNFIKNKEKKNTPIIDAQRFKIEQQMQKELADIKKKYQNMFTDLGGTFKVS